MPCPFGAKNIMWKPLLPTTTGKNRALRKATPLFSTIAMPMPVERMRVGISSVRASQTQTPGPNAKNAMNAHNRSSTHFPVTSPATGP